jgi:hypothetical protein
MAEKITGLRVVLASPSDVKREREAFARVIDQVNNDTARPGWISSGPFSVRD